MASGRAHVADAVSELVAPVVVGQGLELETVTVLSSGRRRTVRVVVDGEAGVSADELAAASRAVSAALDALDPSDDPLGQGPYTLEVTTPGVDRPLTKPSHWRRARGRLVTATVREGAPVTGRVMDVTEDGPVLETESAGRVALAWSRIVRGAVQVEFDHPEKAWAALEEPESGESP